MRKRTRFSEKTSSMGFEENIVKLPDGTNKTCQEKTISVHAFSDLTHVSPVVFLYLLKECYAHGTCKAAVKFRALQQQVYNVLCNSPQPGVATFVLQCLYVLPIFELHSEGFSHLILSALGRFQKATTTSADPLNAKRLAARLTDVEEVVSELKAQNDYRFNTAKASIEQYLFGLIESQSYMIAVTLLEHFSIRQSGHSFLFKMIENKEFSAAEKWATFMGRPVLSILVQEYANRNMLKNAYVTIKKNNLQEDFPDIYHKCKESILKKLAEKGCWDVAEARAKGDRQLLQYLVFLAMEAGYSEKVDELCECYSLEGFLKAKGPEAAILRSQFLSLNDLAVEDVIWVDEFESLHNVTFQIEGCKVIGLDCEWKPNFVKGSQPNKVSIMQIASDKLVFIFDLIKLYEKVPDALDNCLTRILQSPRILKLGYNFQCDLKQLAHSYGDLECFKHCERLLDVQNVFKEAHGGLSGLAEKILGVGLNKTRRNSNWEQRPLSKNQLEYAALDAVALIHIFRRVDNHSQSADVSDVHDKVEWKSHIVSYVDNSQRSPKKNQKMKKQLKA
ncbi:hypothetical protein SLA2020_122390 [Shorea laevis]